MDGSPALQFREGVLGNLTNAVAEDYFSHQRNRTRGPFGVDFYPENITDSSHLTKRCIFEDNATLTQMISKGRSPTLRHVTRTRRVNLDWLLERINADQSIRIRYVRTCDQCADLLTKGTCSSQQWTHLLNL